MKLSIATPDRRVAAGVHIQSVTVPGEKGEMTILPGHAALISTLGIGVFSFVQESGKREVAALSRGFVQVNNDEIIVLADRLELAHEIDVERAKRAQAKAEEALRARERFQEDMEAWTKKMQEKLQRALIRQEAAQFLLPPH
ncbi:MAG: ATP synthase F1 subunit epsilon [Deltaproteobacteria bacterium]|nr:ATP synthase F1 subunit epsilon [Deltaproteobacteria bacterium]